MSDDEAARISSHVLDCDSCARRLDQSVDDPLMRRLRASCAADDDVGPPLPVLAGGAYEVLEEIGRGGCGIVYLARRTSDSRLVALKRLKEGALADRDQLLRFQRESRTLARLSHPNIVQILEAGELAGEPILAMEHVDGESLGSRLAAGPLDPRSAAELLLVVARGVAAAHALHVIHRDLKPGNILLPRRSAEERDATRIGSDDLSRLRIIDFGLARTLAGDASETCSAALLGTPAYMAPEQVQGDRNHVGPAVDVYSLGVILFETLVGRVPWSGGSHFETLQQIRSLDPPRPRSLRSDVPKALDAICMRCLERDPHRRYATAGLLAEDLDRFLRGASVEARLPGTVRRAGRWMSRHPVVAVALVALALGVAGLGLHTRRLGREIDRANDRTREALVQRQLATALFLNGMSRISRMNEATLRLMDDPNADERVDIYVSEVLSQAKEMAETAPSAATFAELVIAHRVASSVCLERRDGAGALEQLKHSATAARKVLEFDPDSSLWQAEQHRIRIGMCVAMLEQGCDLGEAQQLLDGARQALATNPGIERRQREMDLEWADWIGRRITAERRRLADSTPGAPDEPDRSNP
ncbi:MAG: serine/threonine protein kinase [Planctomyces sp.]|nr:serine/threonine protein kinase [Planctomyces sp.]